MRTIMEISEHTDIRITMELNAFLMPGAKRAALASVSELLVPATQS
jgi:hypothetical protein